MISILKIPFDSGNPTGAKGPASAPEEICKYLPKELKKIDVKVNSGNFEETQDNITKSALKEIKLGRRVVGLGGDHSVTYGLIRAVSKVHKNLGLIYFDAHLDCEDNFLPPSHEDVIRAIVNQKLVKPENILIIGVRKFWPKEKQFVDSKHINVIYGCKDIEQIKQEINSFQSKVSKLYISIDIDVFDPKFAPGTLYKEKKGFKKQNFLEILEEVKVKHIGGIDITEVSPDIDFQNKTVRLPMEIIKKFSTN